jgi:hypothetical protein
MLALTQGLMSLGSAGGGGSELSLDGSTWDGWTVAGGTALIEAGQGDPSAPCWFTPYGVYGFRALPSFTTGRRIRFRVRPRSGSLSLGTFFFGCNASGAGMILRLDARGANCGIGTATNWGPSVPGPTQAQRGTLAVNVWYLVEIEMTSPTAGLWRLDGVTVGTFTGATINGNFIALSGNADVGITPPFWDTLETFA